MEGDVGDDLRDWCGSRTARPCLLIEETWFAGRAQCLDEGAGEGKLPSLTVNAIENSSGDDDSKSKKKGKCRKQLP
jgi:hypothetical protein